MTDPRTPKNAAGPFFVVKDECISCRAPEAEARGLMSSDEEHSTCFFERQPTTTDEEYRAIRAVWASCCGAVRYAGNDPRVLDRLENLEQGRVATAVTFAGSRTKPQPTSSAHRRKHGERVCRVYRQCAREYSTPRFELADVSVARGSG